MRRFLITLSTLLLSSLCANAQFNDCITGLLQAPSAEMERKGTLLITNNFLNETATPKAWYYNTFGYGLDITLWSRLELAYVMTIFDEKNHPYEGQSYRSSILFNQDRHFAAKVLLFKEKEFGWSWMPAIALGVSDPFTANDGKGYIESDVSVDYNGYFNRFFAVATKHFNTGWGEFGITAGYQYSLRKDYNRKGPVGGITWRPSWLQNRVFSPQLVVEYDANTFNAGIKALIWDDRFELMFDMQNFRWINFGLRFRLHIKGGV